MNSLYPLNSVTHNRDIARKILYYFLEAGFVNLYFSKWGSDEIKEIQKSEAIQIIIEEKFWDPPSLNEICIKVGSTKKGKDYYDKELIEDINF